MAVSLYGFSSFVYSKFLIDWWQVKQLSFIMNKALVW